MWDKFLLFLFLSHPHISGAKTLLLCTISNFWKKIADINSFSAKFLGRMQNSFAEMQTSDIWDKFLLFFEPAPYFGGKNTSFVHHLKILKRNCWHKQFFGRIFRPDAKFFCRNVNLRYVEKVSTFSFFKPAPHFGGKNTFVHHLKILTKKLLT